MEAFQITFDFSTSLPIVVEPSAAQLSSDAGLLPIRQLDEKLGLTEQFAGALVDRRVVGSELLTYLLKSVVFRDLSAQRRRKKIPVFG